MPRAEWRLRQEIGCVICFAPEDFVFDMLVVYPRHFRLEAIAEELQLRSTQGAVLSHQRFINTLLVILGWFVYFPRSMC